MDEEHDSSYRTGYCKPPKHTQFKPGQSGNPRGRPKKHQTFVDDIASELSSSVTVMEGEKRRRMTKRRAIVKRHVNKALNGDTRSTELLLKASERQQVDTQDNLASLLEEFRERNRRIQANDTTTPDNE